MADEEKEPMKENETKGGGELSQEDIDKLMSGGADAPEDNEAKDSGQDQLAEDWARALEAGEEIEEGK
ncbi:MAG: hypothetical protein WDA72_07215, partial [Desulfomonilia bacterium]